MKMLKTISILCVLLVTSFARGTESDVRIEPPDRSGTRSLKEMTASTAIQNYLQAWQSFRRAFEQNSVDSLQQDFVGIAKDKLSDTIRQQSALGIRSSYQDEKHDIQVTFYSPEGLSLELIDKVEFDVRLLGKNVTQATEHVRSKYIVVMTPAETRWKVRVFQAEPE